MKRDVPDKAKNRKWTDQGNRRYDTVRILGLGFLCAIITGAFLLSLPISTNGPIAFQDALFTAVSSVCVTGLLTVVPAVQYTLFGKIIILLLCQLGGLGIVAVVMLFFLVFNQKITVGERVMIQESYGLSGIGGTARMIRRILIGTFAVEGVGAVLYTIAFIPVYGVRTGIWYGIFHAVSAFCNAGIDILGDSSLAAYALNPLVNVTTMLLIVLSGLGFIVWFDVLDTLRDLGRRHFSFKTCFRRLTLHSKLVLTTTPILIVGGAAAVMVLEYRNPGTIGNMNIGNKVMASFFQSVTDRTAGFYTFSQSAMHDETKLFNMLLMLIGGSSTGTAGGIKTTTAALLVLTVISTIKGNSDAEAFGRRISAKLLRTALTIAGMAFTACMIGTFLILCFEADTIPLTDVLYEAISAIGTVGLSADLTPRLTRESQAVLMVLMYIGRIGPLTMALMFVKKNDRVTSLRRLPEEEIMIG